MYRGNEVQLITKRAPEWLRFSYPVIRSPARYLCDIMLLRLHRCWTDDWYGSCNCTGICVFRIFDLGRNAQITGHHISMWYEPFSGTAPRINDMKQKIYVCFLHFDLMAVSYLVAHVPLKHFAQYSTGLYCTKEECTLPGRISSLGSPLD